MCMSVHLFLRSLTHATCLHVHFCCTPALPPFLRFVPGLHRAEGVKELWKSLWSARKPIGSAKTLAKHFRTTLKVTKRAARARIARTTGEEDRRLRHAEVWQRRAASWWSDEIHAYIDNKIFVVPMTQQEKKRHRQSKVTYHLRKRSEGGDLDYIVPKTKRVLTGTRSTERTHILRLRCFFVGVCASPSFPFLFFQALVV
jgi:hypothetical protein